MAFHHIYGENPYKQASTASETPDCALILWWNYLFFRKQMQLVTIDILVSAHSNLLIESFILSERNKISNHG